MANKDYLSELLDDERRLLAGHLADAKRHRDEANVYAKWAKQIIDRARARQKAKEKTSV